MRLMLILMIPRSNASGKRFFAFRVSNVFPRHDKNLHNRGFNRGSRMKSTAFFSSAGQEQYEDAVAVFGL